MSEFRHDRSGDPLVEQLEPRVLLCGDSSCLLDPGTPISGTSLTPGHGVIVAENSRGEPVVFEETDSSWRLRPLGDLTPLSLPSIENEFATWTDPDDGLVRIAAISNERLLLFKQDQDRSWSVRDLTAHVDDAQPIVRGLTSWVSPDGVAGIAGYDEQGHLVRYYENGEVDDSDAPVAPVRPVAPSAPIPPAQVPYPWEINPLPEIAVPGTNNFWARVDPFFGPYIEYDPFFAATKSPGVITFIRLHEYGHHVFSHHLRPGTPHQNELQADCFAIELLVRRNPKLVDLAITDFVVNYMFAGPSHPSSDTRVANAQACANAEQAEVVFEQQQYQAALATFGQRQQAYQVDLAEYQVELSEYQQDLASYVPDSDWSFMDITASQLAPQGLETPALVGEVTAFVTSWGGLNITGLNADGQIEMAWWSPGMRAWHASNISTNAGTPILAGDLSVVVTQWDAVHINATTRTGDVVSTWWRPRFNGWAMNNLSEETSLPPVNDAYTSSVVDRNGTMRIVSRTSEAEWHMLSWNIGDGPSWTHENITLRFSSSSLPISRLSTSVGLGGLDGLLSVNQDGHLIRFDWLLDGDFDFENLSLLI